jgi:hypothetical protein
MRHVTSSFIICNRNGPRCRSASQRSHTKDDAGHSSHSSKPCRHASARQSDVYSAFHVERAIYCSHQLSRHISTNLERHQRLTNRLQPTTAVSSQKRAVHNSETVSDSELMTPLALCSAWVRYIQGGCVWTRAQQPKGSMSPTCRQQFSRHAKNTRHSTALHRCRSEKCLALGH